MEQVTVPLSYAEAVASVIANYERVQMSAALLERLLEALRPFSVHLAEVHLAKDAVEGQSPDYRIKIAHELIATGGSTEISEWTVADEKGVTRDFRTPAGEPDLSALDRCSSFEMRVTVVAPYMYDSSEIFLKRYIATTGPGGLYVSASADDSIIDGVLAAVEGVVTDYIVSPPPVQRPPFKVFIGHGGDPQWKYLQKSLVNMHNIRAEAFESTERAGYHTLVVVGQMVRSSAVAVVVMTGEDTMPDGSTRARENVVHEIGFCQGALGIDRTIVVMEEGISEPSNITGLTQIRFPKGRLIDVEDRIVAAIKQRQLAHDYEIAP